jgi:hypothetical protein
VANANNSVCGVGVAYDAQIAGIRILDGPITDLLEARALSYRSKLVDIRSASWGPKDDGTRMEYPGRFVNLALEEGVRKVNYFFSIFLITLKKTCKKWGFLDL